MKLFYLFYKETNLKVTLLNPPQQKILSSEAKAHEQDYYSKHAYSDRV